MTTWNVMCLKLHQITNLNIHEEKHMAKETIPWIEVFRCYFETNFCRDLCVFYSCISDAEWSPSFVKIVNGRYYLDSSYNFVALKQSLYTIFVYINHWPTILTDLQNPISGALGLIFNLSMSLQYHNSTFRFLIIYLAYFCISTSYISPYMSTNQT